MKSKVKEEDYLKNIPVLLIKEGGMFEIIDKGEQIFFAQNNDKKFHLFFQKIGFNIPKKSYLELDSYSSYVYKQIDGKRDIYTIGQRLKRKYGEEAEPLYERLELFLEHLKNDKKWIKFK